MNRIDFLKYQQFPMSSETMAFMQDMVALSAKLASIGGSCYILDGCEDIGDNVNPGTVVVNGEILPFAGGFRVSSVVIQEEKDGVQVYDDTYTDLYIKRKVIFGSGGSTQLPWSSFQRLPSLTSMAQTIASLDSALTWHINNHTVAWDKVTGKPSAFPPTGHGHDWSSISGKPAAYPPEAHAHPGTIAFIGDFNAVGTLAAKHFGSIDVNVTRLAGGRYQLTHRIGHTRYMVFGVALGDQFISLRAMESPTNDTVQVNVSDDGTGNDCAIRFAIIVW